MQRDDIGTVTCPFCGHTAHVRKNAKAKLYYYCPERCGIVQPALPAFQEWILNNAKLFTPVEPEPKRTEDPTPDPDPEPEPEPKKQSFIDKMLTFNE